MPELTKIESAREALVREHIESEVRHDIAGTVATFTTPRYEVIPTGETFEGPEQVAGFLGEASHAFNDFTFETHALYHSHNAVIAEVTFHGTHTGVWRGLPATHRRVAYRMLNVFVFDGDKLVCERLYFDLLTVLRQLGIARDPTTVVGRIATFLNHPWVTGKAAVRALISR